MDENLTLAEIRDEIIRFKNDSDFQKLQNFYYSKSYSEILGVSRREVSHSKFLAWLKFPIKNLLDIFLKFSKHELQGKYGNLFHSFVTESYSIEKVLVTSEYVIRNVGRVNLFIELSILISAKQTNVSIIY
jgi:hypothetical protein